MESQHTWYELFRQCASYGLKPEEVLNMNLGQIQAYIDGMSDEFTRQQCADIELAHWNRYYVMGKKPKPPSKIIKEILDKKKLLEKAENRGFKDGQAINETKPDVDVEALMRRDAEFKRRLALSKE